MCEALRGARPHASSCLLFDDDGHEIDKRENRAVLVEGHVRLAHRGFAPRRFRDQIVAGLVKLSAG